MAYSLCDNQKKLEKSRKFKKFKNSDGIIRNYCFNNKYTMVAIEENRVVTVFEVDYFSLK
jgi:hypothetical protein